MLTIICAPVDAFEVVKVGLRAGCARLLSSLSTKNWMRESINDTGGEHVVPTILLDRRGSADHRSVAVINEHPAVIIHRLLQGVQRCSLPLSM